MLGLGEDKMRKPKFEEAFEGDRSKLLLEIDDALYIFGNGVFLVQFPKSGEVKKLNVCLEAYKLIS